MRIIKRSLLLATFLLGVVSCSSDDDPPTNGGGGAGAGAGAGAGGSGNSSGAAGKGGSSAGMAGAAAGSAGSIAAGGSGGSGPVSEACNEFCACYEMKCAGFVAIPGGMACTAFCETFVNQKMNFDCRLSMCEMSGGPAMNNNDHCQHSLGMGQCND